MLFWTELNVLLFGFCFGNKKVQAIKIIVFSFVLSSIYIGLQVEINIRIVESVYLFIYLGIL